jgi:DNA polymerase I-like protein with 3'-5' exonuclease and polymerase domains
MRVIVFDLETGTSMVGDNIRDNSPFNPNNPLVSLHWKMLRDDSDPILLEEDLAAPKKTIVVHHKELAEDNKDISPFVEDYKSADLGVAHNYKFDGNWLRAIGLEPPPAVWCTMVGEYILARGNHVEKSLKATAERRGTSLKKSDLIDAEFKSGKEFWEIDLAKVVEYAEADVQSCAEIYIQQLEDLKKSENQGLRPTFTLMNEMLLFLMEIESNGIKIDSDVLAEVGREFQKEKEEIAERLEEIVRDVMGDTPINLNSGPDMCAVVYSRKLKHKDNWKTVMNLGTDWRGKPLYPPRMSNNKFVNEVRYNLERVMQTTAFHCHSCKGTGRIRKIKKDGTPWKNESPCQNCEGKGAIYQDNGKVAGLKMIPEGPRDASVHGFKTDKITLRRLIGQAEQKGNLVAVEFLTKMIRLNAINTYLDSFVTGIQTWVRADGLLHAQFNQTITKTGRLSSSQPNFQNQPKGGKFPVRKAVVSRHKDGWIYEADFSGLEFRVAGELSRDPQIIEDILSGKDVHKQTASIIQQCDPSEVTKEMRQAAKAYTFAPLYGGMGAQEAPHVQNYFKEYFNIYKGLAEWHKTLFEGVLDNGIVRVPSGREYYFPDVKRISGGRVTNATAIVNYPVQGWATGDLVVLSCVRAYRMFKQQNLQSKLILTVHDSICVDVHPDEEQAVIAILKDAMMGVVDEAKERWNYDFVLPLDIEISKGRNWMELEEIPLDGTPSRG